MGPRLLQAHRPHRSPGRRIIAEDIQLDEDTAFALVGHPDKIRAARAADELLDALERACALIDRIRDTCEYEGGLPVTFLEARAIEIIHGDAVTELPAMRDRGETQMKP